MTSAHIRLHPDVPVVLDDGVKTGDVRIPASIHFQLQTGPTSRAARRVDSGTPDWTSWCPIRRTVRLDTRRSAAPG